MAINSVAISGNLTRAPELKELGGTSCLSFCVAVNDRRKNQQTGEWEDVPNFVDCTLWGSRAESLGKWLHKGSKVSVSGRLRYSSWEKDGQKRSKLEVNVNELEFMAPKGDAATGENQHPVQPRIQPQQPQQPQRTAQSDIFSDDIPF